MGATKQNQINILDTSQFISSKYDSIFNSLEESRKMNNILIENNEQEYDCNLSYTKFKFRYYNGQLDALNDIKNVKMYINKKFIQVREFVNLLNNMDSNNIMYNID